MQRGEERGTKWLGRTSPPGARSDQGLAEEQPQSRIGSAAAVLDAVCGLALLASEPVEFDSLARRTVDVARDIVQSDGASLFLWHEPSWRLAPIAANDPGWDSRAVRSFQPGEGVTGATFQTGRPLIIRDYLTSQHAITTAVAQGVKSGVAIPVRIGRRRVGVLSARSYRHLQWDQQHVRLLSLIAAVAAPALEVASSQASVTLLRLTPKETEVLAGLMAGKRARGIARQSGVSEATVRSHIRAVLAKFGVSSQLAAVVMARDLGLAPTESRTERA